MSTMTELPPGTPAAVDPDVPIELHKSDTGADRAFRLVLAAARPSCWPSWSRWWYSWPSTGGRRCTSPARLFTGSTWAPDLGRFGMLPLLVGSIAIALVALVIALPGLAGHRAADQRVPAAPAPPVLTGVVDLLATVPSIVYGFWGLALVSGLQAPAAKWLVAPLQLRPVLPDPARRAAT